MQWFNWFVGTVKTNDGPLKWGDQNGTKPFDRSKGFMHPSTRTCSERTNVDRYWNAGPSYGKADVQNGRERAMVVFPGPSVKPDAATGIRSVYSMRDQATRRRWKGFTVETSPSSTMR